MRAINLNKKAFFVKTVKWVIELKHKGIVTDHLLRMPFSTVLTSLETTIEETIVITSSSREFLN